MESTGEKVDSAANGAKRHIYVAAAIAAVGTVIGASIDASATYLTRDPSPAVYRTHCRAHHHRPRFREPEPFDESRPRVPLSPGDRWSDGPRPPEHVFRLSGAPPVAADHHRTRMAPDGRAPRPVSTSPSVASGVQTEEGAGPVPAGDRRQRGEASSGRRAGGRRGFEQASGQAQAVGGGGGLTPAGDAELGQDVRHVDARRLRRDEQLLRDVAVAAAVRDQAQDLLLPRR
jgi:hypothetical protein